MGCGASSPPTEDDTAAAKPAESTSAPAENTSAPAESDDTSQKHVALVSGSWGIKLTPEQIAGEPHRHGPPVSPPCIRAGFDELSAGLESKVGAYRQEFAVHHKVVRSLFSKFAAMKPESMSDEVANAAEWKVTHTFIHMLCAVQLPSNLHEPSLHTCANAVFRCWRMPLQIPN